VKYAYLYPARMFMRVLFPAPEGPIIAERGYQKEKVNMNIKKSGMISL
jgi:hypothetical protein